MDMEDMESLSGLAAKLLHHIVGKVLNFKT